MQWNSKAEGIGATVEGQCDSGQFKETEMLDEFILSCQPMFKSHYSVAN